MDPRISQLGNELLTPIAAQKQPPPGTSAQTAVSLRIQDLRTLNPNQDNRITVDELKGALAQQRGVALDSLVFLPEDEAQLAEDARDLTTFLRRGGKLEGNAQEGFRYVAPQKQPSLNELRTADHHENPLQLGPGAKGEDIRKLHVLINNLHVFTEGYTALDAENDTYDAQTQAAIEAFQRQHNLLGPGSSTRPGILDGRTLRVLEREVHGVIKVNDLYTPFVPVQEFPGVPNDDPERLATLQKFADQLAAKGLDPEQIQTAFETAHGLAEFSLEAIRSVEAKIRGGSDGYCYTGVKEAMEGALAYKYQTFSGRGGTWASTADDNIFLKRPDLFAQLEVSKAELEYLPAGAIVVYEPPGKVGHIGIKSYDDKGRQLDLSDRVRTGRPYPNAPYKVFLPIKPTPPDDRNYATEKEQQDLFRLEYAARQTQAKRRR